MTDGAWILHGSLLVALLGGTGAGPAAGSAPPEPPAFLSGEPAIYRPYRADPLGFRTGIQQIRSDLTDSDHVHASVGSHLPLYGAWWAGGRIQLVGLFVGHTRFDLAQDADLIGTDWRYGFGLAGRKSGWSGRLELVHTSSHLGDELAESAGTSRTNYAAEEIALQISRDMNPWLRLYGGAAYGLRQTHTNENQRFLAGLEYFFLDRYTPSGLGPYLAVHVDMRGEVQNRPAVSTVLGYAFAGVDPGRALDVILLHHNGPTPLRQFFQSGETFLGFGVAVDL